MAKVTVKTIGAIVDGHPIGSTIDIDERSVESFVRKGYVEVVKKPKSAPKAKAKAANSKADSGKAKATKSTKK